MEITAKTVMELRKKTGAGMMDCKKALKQTEGDIEEAITYLREKGISKAAKKAERVAAEGVIFSAVSTDHKTGAMLEFNSETDFAAKNKEFISLGEKVCQKVLNEDISNLDQLIEAKLEGKKIQESITELIAKIGENMKIRRFVRAQANGFVCSYLHMGGKIGVLLVVEDQYSEANYKKAKDVAMQIAAMDPAYIDRSEVTEDDLEKEKSIIRVQLVEEGKPENIIDKILIGKMNKFYEENCLLQQKFVKDDKITVQQYLKGLKLNSYYRFKLGEGIEKKEEDFAAEVAAQMKG